MIELLKWYATISNCLSRYMTYKANFVLTLLAPTFVFVAINYAIWSSIFEMRVDAPVGTFSRSRMLQYQCWILVVTLLARSHRSWNLSEDIRHGRISSFLLYPFAVWKYHCCEFIAFQCVQLVAAGGTVILLLSLGLAESPSLSLIGSGMLLSFLVGFLWFGVEFFIGLFAFWLEEVWIVRVVVQLTATLLSGSFIPLELFPTTVQTVVAYTPFPLLADAPVAVFMGRSQQSIFLILLQVLGWGAVVWGLAVLIWKRGVRLYSGAGM